MTNGIDVSAWQGDIDFAKVKAAGIDFVIIKAGGSDDGFYTDSKFEQNYKNAKAAGLHVGAYYYPGRYFVSEQDGIADAERFYQIIKGKQFDMPLYVDIEEQSPADKDAVTKATVAFCRYLENKKYWAGVYGSEYSTFKDRLRSQLVEPFTWWVANYGAEPTHGAIWQNSCTGKIPGINGDVDTDICYVNFPVQIIGSGYNGYECTNDVIQIDTVKSKLLRKIKTLRDDISDLESIINIMEV